MRLSLGVLGGFSTALLLAGCSSHGQQISVTTDPIGAEVYMQRTGRLEVHGAIAGVGGAVDGGSFQDDFVFLGTSPIDYEFRLSERAGGGYVAGSGGSVTKHYREGRIRVEMEGYRTAERLVAFTGDPIDLVFRLQRTTGTPPD